MAKLIINNENCAAKKYSDGKDVEERLFKFAKKGKIVSNKDDWPTIYHFSKHRENILNWYPFKKNSTILEIGGGCGALTNLLSRRGSIVDSVELELSRANINYERNKNTNSNIIVDNINNIKNKKYDYIVVIGVLEYAARFYSNSNEAFVELIKKCKTLLNKDGIILLAIENRYGLKYFSGCKEDHLNVPFVGINGYQNSDIKTFTKNELKEICNKAGIKIKKWYYPYPDYKFPFEIFTDNSINRIFPISNSLPMDFNQKVVFDEDMTRHYLMREKINAFFSNSFLLELNNKTKENIDYVKISSNRSNKFAIATYIDSKKKKVYKIALHRDGYSHLKKISHNDIKIDGLKTIRFRYCDKKLHCKYIKGENLSYKIYQMSLNNEVNKIKEIVSTIKSILYRDNLKKNKISKSFQKIFGIVNFQRNLHWNKKQCIDIIASNIIINRNKYYLIDNEWAFNFSLPNEYILWRFIYYLPIKNIFTKKELISKVLEIDDDTFEKFYKMEIHFVRDYVGTEIDDYYKQRTMVKI